MNSLKITQQKIFFFLATALLCATSSMMVPLPASSMFVSSFSTISQRIISTSSRQNRHVLGNNRRSTLFYVNTRLNQAVVSYTTKNKYTNHSSSRNRQNNENNNKENNNIHRSPPKILKPLVICGPSGVGKGTIIQKYMEEYNGNDKFAFTVSHTTRQPRPGEVDGIHYHYITKDIFETMISQNKFLEYANVHDNFYGTSWKSIYDIELQPKEFTFSSQKHCLLDIDVQGVKTLKLKEQQQQQQQKQVPSSSGESEEDQYLLQPKYIFISPPSIETLYQRLKDRNTETEESLRTRTNNAQNEMNYGLQEGNFDVVVVNDDLNQACIDFNDAIETLYFTSQ